MEQMESDNAAIREALEGTGVLDKPSNLLTLQQAADAIGVSYRTAQRMVANDEMPGAVYVKRRWKVSRRKLERYYGLTD
ncbi:helix-turn-helix domain-containing protein [Olsenella sp. YH-ols2217]|uniref:Helix-turn-helix domain-containing protein n=2 Tax=Kribbibacterium absianum TaxID=3044210 RepID=A0ABT6ZL85_9ACTN|nr:helix-turn-helix domain-containing protein [Olsenella sp. YH-ols2217]MDJ1121804.1 helix-turn-helix domain-containing protein [Olsenella sp. YH-ols2216]MDJ1129812.1 helix-turn-helix domain-containing protein [Olsenella sp. YH-ols2217]